MKDWWLLTTHLGEQLSSPTLAQVEGAIAHLNDQERDIEHGNVSLSYGKADGSLVLLDYYPYGNLIYSEYRDQEFRECVSQLSCPSPRFGIMPLTKAFALLLEGSTSEIAEIFKRVCSV